MGNSINSHLMLWNVDPETTFDAIKAQAEGFFGMGAVPEVQGQLLARHLNHEVPGGGGGLKQANPYRPRGLDNFDSVPIRRAFEFFFAIEFPNPAAESEDLYGPHQAHRDFAWNNCRTIWSEYLHQDFVTETVETDLTLPERRVLHFDFWHLWPDADPSAVDRMYAALATMPERVPQLLRIRYGRRDATRPRGMRQIGVKEELGLRDAIPWHFRHAGGQFDGYFQMEFESVDAFMRYREGSGRIDFANEFVAPLWSAFHTQRFERIPPPSH